MSAPLVWHIKTVAEINADLANPKTEWFDTSEEIVSIGLQHMYKYLLEAKDYQSKRAALAAIDGLLDRLSITIARDAAECDEDFF